MVLMSDEMKEMLECVHHYFILHARKHYLREKRFVTIWSPSGKSHCICSLCHFLQHTAAGQSASISQSIDKICPGKSPSSATASLFLLLLSFLLLYLALFCTFSKPMNSYSARVLHSLLQLNAILSAKVNYIQISLTFANFENAEFITLNSKLCLRFFVFNFKFPDYQ